MDAPFDMSALQQMMNDPEIKRMAEQMAQDPALQQLTASLNPAARAAAGASGGEVGAAGAAAGAPPGMPDPTSYMEAMQNIMSNPEFAKMAEDLGKKMFEQDPALAQMAQSMGSPEQKARMEAKMAELESDPEVGAIVRELKTEGPSAMMKYWNDPEVMSKLGKKFEGMPGLMGPGMFGGMGGGAGAVGAAQAGSTGAEDEEAAAEEDEEEEVSSPFLAAAMEGDLDTLKQLMKDGGDDFDVDEADGEGRTALHFATGYGELEVAKELLAKKANVNSVDSNNNTPLHYAAGYGQLESVQLLLDSGAGLMEKNDDGKTPLEVATLNEQTEIAELLKSKEEAAYL